METPNSENLPKQLLFESQSSQEKVLLLLRAHIITNLPWILITFFLLLIPLFVLSFNLFSRLNFNLIIPERAIFGAVLIWYLLVFAFAFQQFLSWYFNVYIVTSERVVDFDFFQLFYRKISSTELSQIEDVTTSSGGVFQLLFNYGNVFIQTAGEVNEFDFLRVPQPANVQKVIEQAIEAERQENGSN